MISARLGGRPQNAWTPSRRRKLVRLYLFTTLDKNEIRDVLRDYGFNPSTSDVQKRLRRLLPKDYAKDFRAFRPSSEFNMRFRFDLIRRSKEGHFARSRKIRLLRARRSVPSTPGGVCYDAFEGPAEAFRNYSISSTAVDSVSAESKAPDITSKTLSRSISESGAPPLTGASHGNCSAHALRNNYPDSYVDHVNSVLSATDSRRSSIASGEIAVTHEYTSWIDRPSHFDSPETHSHLNVACQLSNGEQEIWNDLVDETQLDCVSEPRFVSLLPFYPEVSLTHRKCCKMPDIGDHDFFCEYCGFTQVHYFAILSLGRVLRKVESINQPDHFGNTPLHCAVATGKMNLNGISYLIENGANVRAVNSLGETFLHLIRSVPPRDAGVYIRLLKMLESFGFPFARRDCHGRTFLHALLEQPSDQILGINAEVLQEICDIVKADLMAMDNRGYTVSVLSVPDLGWKGIVTTANSPRRTPLPALTVCGNSALSEALGWQEMWTMPEISEVPAWLGQLNIREPTTWIDVNGDTVLNAILKFKCWEIEATELRLRDTVKKLISCGAQIHIRDANGDTPLAIATKRGFRPVLSALLDAGANPNTRNYRGTGILSQATLSMLRAAQNDNDRLYAMIQSCFSLLADSGAKTEPTQMEEWLAYATRVVQSKGESVGPPSRRVR